MHEDSAFLTASALAFVTLLSLIPFLAAFSFVGARVFHQYPEKSLAIFVQVLPYSDRSLTSKLGEFLGQAEGLHGFGVAALFATTLFAFSTVEGAINRIWNVSRRRPFRVLLLSYSLFLFWGPLFIGAAFSSLLLLRQSLAEHLAGQGSALLHLAPFGAAIVGLTTLYWIVPYTRVQLRSALAGGLLAAILLELLRRGFGYYVALFRGVSTVYGSSAFVLLFMISIELAWAIVLLGSEAAYTAQHFALLSRGLHRHPPVQASWVGLSALSLIAGRFVRGEPSFSRHALAERLHLPPGDLDRTLHPLVTHDLLRITKKDDYLLAADPRHLNVARVFEAYEHRARRGVEPVGGDLRRRLEDLASTVAGARVSCLGHLTLADLVASDPTLSIPARGAPPSPPPRLSRI